MRYKRSLGAGALAAALAGLVGIFAMSAPVEAATSGTVVFSAHSAVTTADVDLPLPSCTDPTGHNDSTVEGLAIEGETQDPPVNMVLIKDFPGSVHDRVTRVTPPTINFMRTEDHISIFMTNPMPVGVWIMVKSSSGFREVDLLAPGNQVVVLPVADSVEMRLRLMGPFGWFVETVDTSAPTPSPTSESPSATDSPSPSPTSSSPTPSESSPSHSASPSASSSSPEPSASSSASISPSPVGTSVAPSTPVFTPVGGQGDLPVTGSAVGRIAWFGAVVCVIGAVLVAISVCLRRNSGVEEGVGVVGGNPQPSPLK